jgi:hypothetical protein
MIGFRNLGRFYFVIFPCSLKKKIDRLQALDVNFPTLLPTNKPGFPFAVAVDFVFYVSAIYYASENLGACDFSIVLAMAPHGEQFRCLFLCEKRLDVTLQPRRSSRASGCQLSSCCCYNIYPSTSQCRRHAKQAETRQKPGSRKPKLKD